MYVYVLKCMYVCVNKYIRICVYVYVYKFLCRVRIYKKVYT